MKENVKAYAGATKPALHLVPPVFKLRVSLAMSFGAARYGAWNWRGTDALPVRASTYVAAMHRHLDAWASGEDVADDSGVDYLVHLAASCAILMNARAAGRFEDDRARLDLAGQRAAAEAVMAGWKVSAA